MEEAAERLLALNGVGEFESRLRWLDEKASSAGRWANVRRLEAEAYASDAAWMRALLGLATPATIPTINPTGSIFKADELPSQPIREPPNCEWCKEPTRWYNGRPQRFCSRTVRPCQYRARDQRIVLANRAKRRENQPEAEQEGDSPGCMHCGKPTAWVAGRRNKFCSKPTPCSGRYHSRLQSQRERRLPSLREPRQLKARINVAIKPLAGSVVAAASPRSPGYDMLAELGRLVPRYHSPADRDEIISTAALHMLEGKSADDAVRQASKQVRSEGAELRYAKNIDDCFFLNGDLNAVDDES